MERKIGEIFEYNGEWYQCVECDSCGKCSLRTTECGSGTKSDLADEVFGECSKIRRSDSKHIIFRKLEKVGEPYTTFVDKTVQNYLLETAVSVPPKDVFTLINNEQRLIAIEIKQNKEDMEDLDKIKVRDSTKVEELNVMEENKQQADKLVTDYTANKITYKEFEKSIIELYADKHTEEKKLNLKPFDIQKAREGKPVCTRDGRKARIICFDRVDAKPILALVTSADGKGEDVFDYFVSGKRITNALESDLDLMMIPEKKGGWVNVYKGGLLDTKSYPTKKEAFDKASPKDYVDTIKINWSE